LGDANRTRDWRIYHDFAQVLIARARALYASEPFGVELQNTVYALDSTTIDLCLTLFPWAKFRQRKAAVKLHTLLDLRGNIPAFIHISPGKTHDVNILDQLVIEPGAFYVMDKGYVDYARLFRLHRQAAFFVTRCKKNMVFTRRESRPVDDSLGLRSDQTIALTGVQASQDYPEPLRRVGYYDQEHRRKLYFLTNNFLLPPLTIAELYRCRWQVELFFKWPSIDITRAKPTHQDVLRNFGQRGEDASLDRRLRLCADRDPQKRIAQRNELQRDLPSFVCQYL